MWPTLFKTDSFVIPTYIVVNSLVFSLGAIWLYARARLYRFKENDVLDVTLFTMIACFIGARSFHVLFEQPQFYWEHPAFVFKFWYGGFVYYGGALLGLGASWWICHRRNLNFLSMGDLFAPVLAGGYALGRVGCLAAGCCYGAPTTMPWGIYFPPGSEAPTGIALHPTQIYSSLWSLGLMAILLLVERRARAIPRGFGAPGQVFGLWMAGHGLGRLVIEQFRDDFRGPTLLNLSVSTWISAAFVIGGVYIIGTRRRSGSAEIKAHASAPF